MPNAVPSVAVGMAQRAVHKFVISDQPLQHSPAMKSPELAMPVHTSVPVSAGEIVPAMAFVSGA